MCVFYKTFAAQRYNFFSTSTRKHAKKIIFCFYLHYVKDHFLSQGDVFCELGLAPITPSLQGGIE